MKKTWVSSIGVFVLSQIIFITLEATGWIPNYRDISGTLFGRITDSSIFKEWFTFYERRIVILSATPRSQYKGSP
ncbi:MULTISPECIES: YfzA family protein [unclassified Lysinibacillus]|uniref:YfzA family protein n=1 Tax=unclassified Lysinibacillus TaxID=2636778 RepID=UPI0038155CEA